MKKIAVNLSRLLIATVFIFSGFVKTNDPVGTQYKIEDYLQALHLGGILPPIAVLGLSVGLAILEFSLGIFMLFGAKRLITSRLILAIMLVMTPLTLWLALADPISDCGCFGDAVVLTNWQTFWKNIVLLTAAIIVAKWPTQMFRLVAETNQWIVVNYVILFDLVIATICLYDRPMFDFRPYHIGANIQKGMEIPEGAEKPVFETTFTMEKNGEQREFSLENYPDTSWTFVSSQTVTIKEGYVPPIHDFSINTANGDDITDEVLNDSSYVFLLVAPHLEDADDSRLDLLNELYEYAQEHSYPFYGLTASGEKAIARWRDMTGAEYEFCQTDETTLKTIIRSNPGLLLLKNGTIIQKWSSNDLPEIDEGLTAQPLEDFEIGHLSNDSVAEKLLKLFAWFVFPLALLVIADRTWMWTKWLRRKRPSGKPLPTKAS